MSNQARNWGRQPAGRVSAPGKSAPLLLLILPMPLMAGPGAADARPRLSRAPEPRAGAVALASAPTQTVELTLPFDGIWGVIQGFSGETHVGYAAYAIDFVPAENLASAVPEKDRRRLTDFPCYGRPVLASADGKVVMARDASADLPLRNKVKRDPGNFVIVEHAAAEYTELRHLQAGSIRVKVGDRVVRGQEIGRCGNSGNAKTPHLHIGLLGSADPIATRPMRFTRYEVFHPADGSWRPGDGIPSVGQLLRRAEGRAGRGPGGAPVHLK